MTRARAPWGRRILFPLLAGAIPILAFVLGSGNWIAIGGVLGLAASDDGPQLRQRQAIVVGRG